MVQITLYTTKIRNSSADLFNNTVVLMSCFTKMRHCHPVSWPELRLIKSRNWKKNN